MCDGLEDEASASPCRNPRAKGNRLTLFDQTKDRARTRLVDGACLIPFIFLRTINDVHSFFSLSRTGLHIYQQVNGTKLYRIYIGELSMMCTGVLGEPLETAN